MLSIVHQLHELQDAIESLEAENASIRREIELLVEELSPILHSRRQEYKRLKEMNENLRMARERMKTFLAEHYTCPGCGKAGLGDPGLDGYCLGCAWHGQQA